MLFFYLLLWSEKENLFKPTLDLLNSKLLPNFDLPKLIEMIPNNWSMEFTNEFLQNALHHNLSRRRNFRVEKNISNQYKFSLQTVLHGLKKEQLYIDEDRLYGVDKINRFFLKIINNFCFIFLKQMLQVSQTIRF